MKKNKIIFCVGVPASGKSTWSKDFVRNNENYARLCRDDYRYMYKDMGWFGDEIRDNLETLITKNIVDNLFNLMSLGFDVVIDETNLDSKRLKSWLKTFKSDQLKDDVDIQFKIFDISFEEALDRDSKRERSVGKKVIKKMFDKYQYLINNFNFKEYGEII